MLLQLLLRHSAASGSCQQHPRKQHQHFPTALRAQLMALIVKDLTQCTDQCSSENSLQQNKNTFHHQSSRAEHNMKIHRIQNSKPAITLAECPENRLQWVRRGRLVRKREPIVGASWNLVDPLAWRQQWRQLDLLTGPSQLAVSDCSSSVSASSGEVPLCRCRWTGAWVRRFASSQPVS